MFVNSWYIEQAVYSYSTFSTLLLWWYAVDSYIFNSCNPKKWQCEKIVKLKVGILVKMAAMILMPIIVLWWDW